METAHILQTKLSRSAVGLFLLRRMKQLRLRYRIYRIRTAGELIKIVVGAGPTRFNGWISTDIQVLNALMPSDWFLAVPRSSVARILLEHVAEHWEEKDFRLFLNLAKPVLARGGFTRIAVPDGFHPDPDYIDSVKPGGTGCGAADHKVLYNYKTLGQIFYEENYAFRFIEYFDENGDFHKSNWEKIDGYVERSAAHDPRNKEKALSYTSLIIDAWPGDYTAKGKPLIPRG